MKAMRHIAALAASVMLGLAGGASAEGASAPAPSADAPKKVFHFAFLTPETSIDPAKVNDLYSRALTGHIFDALYKYDHLARPVKITRPSSVCRHALAESSAPVMSAKSCDVAPCRFCR